MFERRTLIVSMTLLAAGGMLITASSQSLSMMILGTALTGLFSVVAQILVPLAATLATPATRGKVVGTIMSGLLLGSCWRERSPDCWQTSAVGAPYFG